MKRYLFWRPPSPPRSSEKFLQFHQHRLKKKSQRKKTQPHYLRVKKKRVRERAREREVEGCGREGWLERGGAAGVADRESDSTLFSPLLLMATNLIICLHSGAAETCSLTYTLTLAHSSSLSLSLSRLSLPSPMAQTKPSSALIHRGEGPWSADVAPDSGGVERPASLSGKWPWMETNRQIQEPS